MPPMALPFPEFSPWAIRIDPAWFGFDASAFGMRWYGLAYLVGLLLGAYYAARLVRRQPLWPGHKPPMAPAQVEGLLIGMIIGVVVGGRLGFVLFYRPEDYLSNPWRILEAWKGGMAFHGGLIGVVLATVVMARLRGFPLLSMGDMVAAVAPIGLFFGRLANFINAELYGRLWDGPWAVTFPSYWDDAAGWVYLSPASDGPRHPSQLYEAALEGVVLFCVLRLMTHRLGALKRPGLVVGAFLILYAVARSVAELFRQPDAFLPNQGFGMDGMGIGLTQGQLLSAPMLLAGAAFVLYALSRRPAPDPAPASQP